VLGQRDRPLEPIEVRVDREHLVAAGRDAVEEERAVVAGDRVDPELADRDDDAGEGAPRAALDRDALQRDRIVVIERNHGVGADLQGCGLNGLKIQEYAIVELDPIGRSEIGNHVVPEP
jgi:hypothetical protein